MAKYYFTEDSIDCFPLDYWKEYMVETGLSELELTEAKPEHGNGYFFCAKHLEIGESRVNCGIKWCQDYVARNGKSGVCKHHRPTYEPTEVKRTLRITKEKLNFE